MYSLSKTYHTVFYCCAAVVLCVSGKQKGLNRRVLLCVGASLSLNSSVSSSGKSVLEVLHEIFHTTLLSLIQKSCICIKNLGWLREQGCTLTARLPKLHGGRCPWPRFDKGLWQWFSKLLRLVSLGTKSCQESELYLPLQQLVWKLCYKIRKKWSNSKKASELLELWLPGADEHVKTGDLPGRYFWIILSVNEKKHLEFAF